MAGNKIRTMDVEDLHNIITPNDQSKKVSDSFLNDTMPAAPIVTIEQTYQSQIPAGTAKLRANLMNQPVDPR
jgi:hypothetical protein